MQTRITVKNVKEYKKLSEETMAYSATLYLDGRKIGLVKNSGFGGETEISSGLPLSYEGIHEAEEIAKALGMKEYDATSYMGAFEIPYTLELLVDDLAIDFLDNKDWKRQCKTKTYFRCEGDEVDSWRVIKSPYNERVMDWMAENYDNIIEIKNEDFI